MKIGRSPHGAPNSERSPGRLTAGARPEFHYVVSPRTRTTHMARSTFAAEYVAAFLIQSSNGPVLCRVGRRLARLVPLAVLNRFLPPVEQNFSLTQRHEPGVA
jgi:hypothetical protein